MHGSTPSSDRDIARHMARECIAFRVRRASRLLTRAYDKALEASGLSSVQVTVLSAVENRPDLKVAELADALGLDPSTLSRALSGLAHKKLVRQQTSGDKRERYFDITDKGREKLRAAFSLWKDAQADVKRTLGADQLAALIDALDELHAPRRARSRPHA